jgi:hypothetical protein
MDGEERRLTYMSLIIAVVLGFLGVTFTVAPSFFQPYSGIIVIGLFVAMFAIVIGIMIYYVRNKEKPIESCVFRNATLYFDHDIVGSPYFLNNPKYIGNWRTRRVYFVSQDFLTKYVRPPQITSYRPYTSERKLKAELLERGYIFVQKEANLSDLDIIESPSGKLLSYDNDFTMMPQIWTRLEQAKEKGLLRDYCLVFLYPWYQRSTKSENKHFPPSKRLLVNTKTHIARPPLEGDLWLMGSILKKSIEVKRFPFEKVSWWCNRKKLKFLGEDTRYDVYELLEKKDGQAPE